MKPITLILIKLLLFVIILSIINCLENKYKSKAKTKHKSKLKDPIKYFQYIYRNENDSSKPIESTTGENARFLQESSKRNNGFIMPTILEPHFKSISQNFDDTDYESLYDKKGEGYSSNTNFIEKNGEIQVFIFILAIIIRTWIHLL